MHLPVRVRVVRIFAREVKVLRGTEPRDNPLQHLRDFRPALIEPPGQSMFSGQPDETEGGLSLRKSVRGSSELVRLDDALQALAQVDDRKSRVIELRFFGGLSVE